MGVGVWEGTSRLGPQAISWLAFLFKEPLLLNTWKVEQAAGKATVFKPEAV